MVRPLGNWFTRYFWNFWDFIRVLTSLCNMYVRLQPRFSWIGWLANFELVCPSEKSDVAAKLILKSPAVSSHNLRNGLVLAGWAVMVFGYQNYSDLLWEKIVQVIEKDLWIGGWRPGICKSFEITKTIYSNSERSEHFGKQNAFSTCSCRFLMSNKLEQVEFKLEKNIGS